MKQEKNQKITAHIPTNLLRKSQAATGKGITETIKIALSQLTHASTYEALRKMRGKVKFSKSYWQRAGTNRSKLISK